MKIDFENLGNIKKGSIELNDFTLFCGKNNSGKTYAMYSIYGLLNPERHVNFDFVKSIVAQLKQDGCYSLKIKDAVANHKQEMIDYIEHNFKSSLPNLFGVDASIFASTKMQLSFSDEGLFENSSFSCDGVTETITNGEILFTLDKTKSQPDFILSFYISERLVNILLFDWMRFFARFLLLPAERAGINLLLKELLSIRNTAIQQAQNDDVKSMRLLEHIVTARYAAPLKDYMQYINDIGIYQKEKGSYQEYATAIEEDVLGGIYKVDEFNNTVFFMPTGSHNELPLHFSSSTIKSLFGLVFYLKHQAKKGDCLMIDEPELNLHPDNQRKVARVLAQLVNAGLKVIVSTHSDYFVRELNNLIMLKKGFSGSVELQREYGYQDNELLDEKRVSAYLFDNNEITKMGLDEEGIIVDTFDDVINKLNQSSNKIYFAMQDAKELDEQEQRG